MKLLIADDEFISRKLLEKKLIQWGFEVFTAEDGDRALELIEQQKNLDMAILDWMMPGMDGVDICKKVRAREDVPYIYIILLTSKDSKSDVAKGLDAGADDYMVKPFDPEELRSRLRAGERIINLERQLAQKISELEEALKQVKQLSGFLPICANCKKIRNDEGYWEAVEAYIHDHTDAVFSHSICPDCAKKLYPELDLDEDDVS